MSFYDIPAKSYYQRGDQNDVAPIHEKLFTICVLLFSTGAVVTMPIFVGTGSNVSGSTGIQVAWSIIYLITLVLLLRSGIEFSDILRGWPLVTLLLLALVSTFWSPLPQLSFRRGIALIGTQMFGVYLVTRYSWHETIKMIMSALFLAAILSLLCALIFPQYGVESGPYVFGWSGVFDQKNSLGRLMSLSFIFWLLTLKVKKLRFKKHLNILFGTLAIALMLLSQSATALVVSLCVLLFSLSLYIVSSIHNYLKISILLSFISLGILLILFITSNYSEVLDLLGKSSTLTGRTELWGVLWSMIQNKFWLGWGYNGFWGGWDGPSASIWSQFNWHPTQAHDGFLNLWLQLGIVGVSLFVVSIVVSLGRGVSGLFKNKHNPAVILFALTYILYMLWYNITESDIMTANSLYWILYVVASLSLITPKWVLRSTERNDGTNE